MAWCVSSFTNPKGWRTVAGGRSAAETPGSGVWSLGILEGCQSSATPAGSNEDFGAGSGGVATLDPRLLSGKPPACSLAEPKPNAY
jgi:hypothetical protein